MTKEKKRFKVTKIIALAAICTVTLTPSTVTFASPIKIYKKKEESAKSIEDIQNDNIGINVGNIGVEKIITNGITDNTKYIPENIVPKEGDIAAIGTSFQYSVPIEFNSKNGKLYNLEDSSISVELNPTGIENRPLTTSQESAVKDLEKDINIKIPKYSHKWNTSGSYIFTTLISINNSLNGVQLNPVMTLKYTANGKLEENSIKLGKILLTRKYEANIKANPSIDNNNLYLNINYEKNSGQVAKYDTNNLGYINGNYNMKEITFKVAAPNGVILVPIKNSDLIVNQNNTYIIKGELLKNIIEGKEKLFNIKYNGVAVSGNIGIKLISNTNSVTFDNGEKTQKGTIVNYENGTTEVKYIPSGTGSIKKDKFNLESKDKGLILGQGNMPNAVKTQFSAKVSLVDGSGIVYVGSAITNGQAIITANNKNMASADLTYVELPQNTIKELTKGTLKEKVNIMKDIINNKYPQYKKGVSILKAGFTPNFMYKDERAKQGENVTLGGEYIKVPENFNGWAIYPSSVSSTIVGIVYNKKVSTQTFGSSEYEGIEKVDDKNSFIGIVSPPNNLFQPLINKTNPWNYQQSSYFRDGEFSHGISSSALLSWAVSNTRFDKFDEGVTKYNEMGHGISSENINQYKEAMWLSQPHTINGVMGVNIETNKSIYENNTFIRVNFGGNAIVTGNIILNGKIVSKNNLQIKKDYVIIKIPENTLTNLLKVTVPIQYTDMNLKTIETSLSPCNEEGISQRGIYPVSHINGKITERGMIGFAENTAFTNNINFIHNTANICQQYSNGMSEDNTTTITNEVNNLGGTETTYTIAGRIPNGENNTLSASLGDLTVGGLSSVLEGLDTKGEPTWVLPNSMLNNPTNKEILDNPYPNTLEGLSSKELQNLGWIKYTKGMSLKKIGGYLVKATVKPGESFTMNYKIKLSNVNNKEFQATSIQYKYYDNNSNIGSTSPVITLTPNGSSENTDWMSSITVQTYKNNSKGQKVVESSATMQQNILNKELINVNDAISKNPTFQDLISHGTDIGENSSLKTPAKLEGIIKFAINNKEAFATLGYKLDYISFNGINIAPGINGEYSMNIQVLMSWLNNVGISNNTTLTKVKFVLSPLKSVPVTVEMKVVDGAGKTINNIYSISKHTVFNGVVGSYLNRETCRVSIPKGYKLVNETVNGERVTPNSNGSTVPEMLGQSGENIIYYITQKPTNINLKIEYPNGKIIDNGNIIVSGIPKVKTDMKEEGYKIEVEGKQINIPKGYEIAQTIVINEDTGNLVSKTIGKINIISNFRNYNIQIIIKLQKMPKYKVTGEVITKEGKVIETIPTTEGYVGESFTKAPEIPKGYNLIKATVNNKEVKVGKDNSITGSYKNEIENIIWIIEKEQSKNIKPINNNMPKKNIDKKIITEKKNTSNKKTKKLHKKDTSNLNEHKQSEKNKKLDSHKTNKSSLNINQNPKTGDNGEFPAILGIIMSILILIGVNKKNKKKKK